MNKTLSTVLVSFASVFVLVPVISFAASFFYVDSFGNVGIGNETPQHRLDVSGALYSRLVTATSTTVNWNLGNVQKATLTSSPTLSFAGAQAGGKYDLIVVQDSTGGREVTWPSSVVWSGGSAPALTSTANAIDTVSFLYDGSSYLGSYALDYSQRTYATWNSADKGSDITLSNGNLTATKGSGTNWTAVRATIAPSSGKWYWEITTGTIAGNGQGTGFGTGSAAIDGSIGPWYNNTQGWGENSANGQFVTNGSVTYTSSAYTTSDVISVAYDADSGKLWWAKNGTWANSGNPAAGTGYIYTGVGANLYPVWSGEVNTNSATANFGQSAFTYSVPSGFHSGLYTQ